MKNFVIKLIVVILFFIVAYNVCKYTPYYIEKVHYGKNEIRLILDDEEKTKSIPDPVMISNGKVMLSVGTIRKYIDEYAYYNHEYDMVMIAYGLNIVKMPVDNHYITENDVVKAVDVPAQRHYPVMKEKMKNIKKMPIVFEPIIYVPIEELSHVYDIQVAYHEKVIITKADAQFYELLVKNKLNIKSYQQEKSRSTGVSKENEILCVFDDYEAKSDDDYLWVRSSNGSLGYVKKGKIKVAKIISNPVEIAKNSESTDQEKISIAWEYAGNYTPDRSSERKKKGLDILAPTWFYVSNTSGDILDLASTSYISWAKRVGYDIWPTIKNDNLKISETSALVTNIYARKALIDNILKLCKKYDLKGINLDFENMYEKNKNEFSAFVRELSITLKQNDILTSVDVNVPDGSANWSRCYDSKAISDAVDYIIVMAYDQYGQSSKKAGSVASLDWVEVNIMKMTKRDGIEPSKLVLGVPFYSRSWVLDANNVVTSTAAIYMSRAKELMLKNVNATSWSEEGGQYIIEYTSKENTVKIYVEDANSLNKKLELVEKYKLAGAAAWRLGFESDDVWKIFENSLK